MRKIEEQMNQAIRECRSWHSGNTAVMFTPGTARCGVFLHGNHLATVSPLGEVIPNRQTLRDWPTPTTCSRLRALGVNVRVAGGEPLLDGRPLELAG